VFEYEFVDDGPRGDLYEQLLASVPRGLGASVTAVPRAERLSDLMGIHGNTLGFVEWCREQAARIEFLSKMDVDAATEACAEVRYLWSKACHEDGVESGGGCGPAWKGLGSQPRTLTAIQRYTHIPMQVIVMLLHSSTDVDSVVAADYELWQRGINDKPIERQAADLGVSREVFLTLCKVYGYEPQPCRWNIWPEWMVQEVQQLAEQGVRKPKALREALCAKGGLTPDQLKYQSVVSLMRRAGIYERKAA